MASVTVQKMRSIDALVDQLVSTGVYNRAHADTIKSHAKAVVQNLLHLTPLQGTFTTNTGENLTLLKMEGVIPTEYQGVTYQTPINLWVPKGYPQEAPIAYVTPTKEMMVERQHAHVDTSGLVCLPCLQSWNPSDNDLVGLIQMMCATFSHAPPLRARPRADASYTQYPMHPTSSVRSPPPAQQPRESSYTPSHSAVGGAGGGYGGMDGSSGIAYTAAASASGSPVPVQPPSLSRQDSAEDPAEVARYRQRVNAKLRSELAALQQRLGTELDREYELKAGLRRSTAQLDAAKASLQGHSAELLAYSTGLSEYKDSLAAWLANAEGQAITPQTAAQAVAPTDVVSAQLLGTVAECAAIEDAYSLLHKMLAAGVITPEQFVRETRRRAVRQFELKALAKKIHALQAGAAEQRRRQRQATPPAAPPAAAPAPAYGGEFVYHHGTPGMPTQRMRPGGW